jgi:single-strand DNA-binding protein
MNKFLGIGNVTAKPELNKTPTGKPWTKFSIAINEFFKNDKGKNQQYTTYIPVAAWGTDAVNICSTIKKGQPILVEGPVHIKHFTDRDGIERSVFQVDGKFFRWHPNWEPKKKEPTA